MGLAKAARAARHCTTKQTARAARHCTTKQTARAARHGVRGGLGQGKEYAEREGRMGGGRGAWVVGVGQAGGHALGGAMGP